AFQQFREIIKEGEIIWVKGRIDVWKDQTKILVNDAMSIHLLRESRVKAVEINLPWRNVSEAALTRVLELMHESRGRRRLWFLLRDDGNEVRLEAGNGNGIKPTSEFIRQLQDAVGITNVHLVAKNGGNGDGED